MSQMAALITRCIVMGVIDFGSRLGREQSSLRGGVAQHNSSIDRWSNIQEGLSPGIPLNG